MKKTKSILVIMLLLITIISCDVEPPKELTKQEQIEKLQNQIEHAENANDANGLLQYYNKNEIKADDRFKNKITYVKGKIDVIGKDIMGDPYITLGGGKYQMASVQCMFDESQNHELAQLSKGQFVIVKGECTGKLMYVMLDDCELVDNVDSLKVQLKELE